MSEYWKSTPKYWCKHCGTYVKDTPFERKQHESTAKHQGNLKRFLRGIQSDHEREERDKNRVKAEVERLNKVVDGSSALAASTSSSSSAKPTFTKNKSSGLSADDQKRQWAQLAEMGIKVPEGAQRDMATAGDWKVIATNPTHGNLQDGSLSTGIRKRKFEDQEEEDEDHNQIIHKGWGSKTKRYPGVKESNDLDDLLNGPVLRKETLHKTEAKDEIMHDKKANALIDAEIEIKKELSIGEDTGGTRSNSIIEAQKKETDTETKVELKNDVPPLRPAIGESDDAPVFKKRKPKSKNNLTQISGAT